MKVTVKDSPNGNEVKFPCLMRTQKGSIIWMSSSTSGVVVKHDYYSVGSYHKDWESSNFTPFTGTVELSND